MGAKLLVRRLVPTTLRQRYQRWHLDRVVGQFSPKIVRHRYGDVELQLELADPLAQGWYDHDWPLPPEIRLLRRSRLRPGAMVFDLGAHQGVVALMLAREVGPSGKVIAVEARPQNAEAARKNRALNAAPWIEVVAAGVAASDGVLRICQGLNAQTAEASDYAGTTEVSAVTIDTLAETHGVPEVIYLDVEGMELQALRGAGRTLTSRPDVFVEVHVGLGLEAAGGTVESVLDLFSASDYEQFVHTETEPEPIPLTEATEDTLRRRFFLTALSRERGCGEPQGGPNRARI